MTTKEMREVIEEVEFDDWKIVVVETGIGGSPYLQVRFLAEDMVTGEMEEQHGRKWQLSHHMTKSELVATAFKAILTAIEHEARETFRYKGRTIFGPHFDVDALAEFAASRDNIDMRTGAWVQV